MAKAFKGHGTMQDIEEPHHKLVFLLDSEYEHKRPRRFVDNLLKRKKEWLFNFVMNPDVEPTNNRAERALRSSVIYRKVSGGSRSEKGAEIQRLKDVIAEITQENLLLKKKTGSYGVKR